MIIEVRGTKTHAATGGVDLDNDNPVVVLIHGAGNDATVWQLQTRYLAYRGFRAVAVDLPGHGHSDGEPLATVGEMASWLGDFLEAAGLAGEGRAAAHLVGHSMGTFIALDLAAARPDLVASVVLLGTATAMPVHPDLIDKAENDLPAAAALMAAWGHAKPAHIGHHPTPGLWMTGAARAMVEQSRPGVLASDFRACADYQWENTISCPATVVIGLGDKMTPAKAGRALAATLDQVTIVELADTGHSMMTENPTAVKRAVLAALSS